MEAQTTKTYHQISEFTRIASMRLNREKSLKPPVYSKLSLCIIDLVGNPSTGELGSFYFVQENYKKDQRKIYRKHASVDAAGNIIKDPSQNYVFTKEAEEACEEELAELNNKKVDFTPVFCPADHLPKDLLSIEKAAYKGFVIE